MINPYVGNQLSSKSEMITELINLKAIMNLPKGTEHFMSDLHGEYEAFQHVLRNASGSVKEKINLCFNNTLSSTERETLTFLVYYPEELLRNLAIKELDTISKNNWYSQTILHLVDLIDFVATKYTRSKVRKALPENFAYITEELLYRDRADFTKGPYFDAILAEVCHLKQAEAMIIGLAYSIQRLIIDHLHVVGDIYDRGPAPDQIIEELMTHHSLDIQWGNHDITWMGAAAGSPLCIMNVLRISARYNNLAIIEDVYGINLRPLLSFAEKHYTDNLAFRPKNVTVQELTAQETLQITQMHQAVAIIQFKLEAQLIKRRPEFKMEHRLLFNMTNFASQEITLKQKKYDLTNTCFQTVSPTDPNRLTKEEEKIVSHLVQLFTSSEKLTRHIDFLMEKGSIYLCYNNNLLIHGCVPLTNSGTFKPLVINQQKLAGKELLDTFEEALRYSYKHSDKQTDLATDLIWYLWTGECSSLFGKNEMTTFERYFIADKASHLEVKNAYYALRNDELICQMILKDFGLSPDDGHIINGHTPVKEIEGENPIKANGKMIVIDGGYSKPYQKTTGIAGYTLISNSYGMQLVAHQPFHSKANAIQNFSDIVSTKRVVDRVLQRKKVKDTNVGSRLQKEINQLEALLLTTTTKPFFTTS